MTLGNNLSISRKLAAGFASVLAVTIAVAAANFFATTAVDDAAQINAVAHRVVIDIERAAAAQYDQAHTARGYIITRVERHKILYGEAIGLFEKEIGAARQDAGDRPEILAAIAGVEAANIAWRHEIGDPEIAFTDDLATAEKAVDVAKSAHSTEMMKGFRAALQAARERISGWSKDAERSQAVAMAINETVLVAGSLLSLALAILANIWLARTVSRPAHAMTDVMHRLAEGNNTIKIPYLGRKDEFGRMASAVEAFKQAARDRARLEDEAAQVRGFMELERETQDSEREAVSQARKQTVDTLGQAMERLAHGDLAHRIAVQDHGSEAEKLHQDFNAAATQLQRTIVTIKANAQAIRSGTDEISIAAGDLSKRTEQQASRLEETATALNEITMTIRETAQGASRAHEIVSVAKDDALKSGDVVRHAIDAMGRIETSSRQIGQIIGVIDEIAFQTSLLALNAGVEAARAGDAGRGFAVVASEVRALAQRSAEAAKEIKSLISTSTGQVDQGVALVGRTGESLERIVMQVAEITAVISQIATSAHDQSAKLHRVNETVGEMDRVTQQNAAMVEETTAATRSLAQETAELTRLIGGFNIGQVTEFEPHRQRRTPAPVVSISAAAAARSAGRQSPAKPPRKVPAVASEDWTEF